MTRLSTRPTHRPAPAARRRLAAIALACLAAATLELPAAPAAAQDKVVFAIGFLSDKGNAIEVIQNSNQALVNQNFAAKALQIGDKTEDFILPNANGKNIRLQELLKQGPVIVNFYRGNWCPFCNIQLQGLQRELNRIKDLGANLVAISSQLPDNTLDNVQKNNLSFEVLSDVGSKVAKQFGVAYKVDSQLDSLFQNTLGFNLKDFNGDGELMLPIPAVFIIKQDGTIVKTHIDTDFMNRLDPEEIIETLKKLK